MFLVHRIQPETMPSRNLGPPGIEPMSFRLLFAIGGGHRPLSIEFGFEQSPVKHLEPSGIEPVSFRLLLAKECSHKAIGGGHSTYVVDATDVQPVGTDGDAAYRRPPHRALPEGTTFDEAVSADVQARIHSWLLPVSFAKP